jgi:glutamyl/glutaminyl-tRNA synthetase
VVEDLIQGQVVFNNSELDDLVILRSDGLPTYNFSVVVDDVTMEITHVIRGEEWLPSTPKHALLYRYFGWDVPRFAHLPLLLNADRSKLSKRQGDVAVEDYRKQGYLPAALVNFVAFLGWNPGGERELFAVVKADVQGTVEAIREALAKLSTEKVKLNVIHYGVGGVKESDVMLAAASKAVTRTFACAVATAGTVQA